MLWKETMNDVQNAKFVLKSAPTAFTTTMQKEISFTAETRTVSTVNVALSSAPIRQ